MNATPPFSFSRRAILALVAGLLIIAAGAAVILWRNNMPDTSSNPTLIENTSGRAGPGGPVIVETSIGGDSAAATKGSLRFRLSEGGPEPQAAEAAPLVAGEPLDPTLAGALLDRLPALPPSAVDTMDLNLPTEILPPPRPGETIAEPFPPPPMDVSGPEVPSGPLEVLRYAPEGEVGLAPFVNITFNQPMVPLTALEDLAARDVPVRLEPDLPGTWKWIGTRTLRFEADTSQADRLPMATEFVATVPAGTTSATGGVLPADVSWRFRTPPPSVHASYPNNSPQPLDPVFFLGFDQLVDPEAVLATIRLTADGDPVSLRLASADELAANETVARLADNAGDGRWLAFRATEPLPADAGITFDVGPGTPSAEGPLRTETAQSFSFRTYAPLRIVDHGCSWGDQDCPPLTPFFIRFNNPIDVDAYAESMVRIEPALPGASIGIYGDGITIQGNTTGRTTYRVVVSGALQDTFGQTLGDDETLRFQVGSAQPTLSGPGQPLVTLDPAASQPVFSVYSINYNRLAVRAYRVTPDQWPDFQTFLREFYQLDRATPPGELALDDTINVEAPADALAETAIDLSPALNGATGQLVVLVEPAPGLRPADRNQRADVVLAWVQVTNIGLDAFADQNSLVAWATDLATGAPLADVAIAAAGGEAVARTGADGVARLALDPNGITTLTATLDDDTAILPRSPYAWGDDRWRARPVQDELRWMVFDDRGMYRPGETVHVKGWVRRVGGGLDGDVGPADAVTSVRYQLTDPQGNFLLDGVADLGGLGGFDFSFDLPENSNLGSAQLTLEGRGNLASLNNTQAYHSFQVQEFRRPEFEVTARNETTGPYLVGGHAVVAVSAQYFAGGALPNADVNWLVSSTPSSYAPPNWPDFTFGKWIPWWIFYGEPSFGPSFEETTRESFAGITDATGNHYLRLDFDEAAEPRPVSIMAEATVFDVNRQAWAAQTSLLVHPADRYVGLRSAATFVKQGEPLDIELIVTDIDGNARSGHPIVVEAARLEWRFSRGDWREEAVDVQTCNLTSADDPVSCTFETPAGGQMRITATVTDEAGRQNQSELTRWVSGGERPPARNVEQEQLTLIPDKESYQPGDVARILVQSPFAPAEGLLTINRDGIVRTERFSLPDGTATLELPIEEAHIPNLLLQVDVVGSAPRRDDAGEPLADAPARPAYATGSLALRIPPLQRTLTLEATPQQKELAPGEETTLDLRLIDASGEPVAGAEVAVVVVDEAILALSNYRLPNPLDIFYADRPGYVDSRYGRAAIVLANPEALVGQVGAGGSLAVESTRVVAESAEMAREMPAMAPAADMAAEEEGADGGAEPIRVRSDFNPLALFAPAVRTGANGRAQVTVKLPDNLTRYRVMVVAADQTNRFGQAETTLTARLPLMVRPSPPRFLNFGDRFELPVVLQNQTEAPLVVDVALRAVNLDLTGPNGLQVTVPANDRVEVRFPATSALPGTAAFQVAAASGAYADAATGSFPVYTPATTEAFATYGVLDEGAMAQPVAAPTDVFPQFGGLEITTSSTALQGLTDAVLYLTSYPFDCSEQLASRILAVAALRDVLAAFAAEGLPAPAELEAAVTRDIETLQGLQNNDGGFPYWQRGRDSIPFHSIHVAHALQRAADEGFTVPADVQSRVLTYLRDIENHFPHWYSKETRQTLNAYALYVRQLMGDRDPAKARQLLNDAGLENLSLEAVAWLWQVLLDDPGAAAEREAIARHLNNRAVETPGAANFTTSYGDDAYLLLASDRRADAVILDALIAADPANDLIPKVVNGLLAHRTRGRWGNTQENVFVLLALDRYFQTFEAQTPDFVARIWLGDTYAGSHAFAGRSTERHETTVPMNLLLQEAPAGAPEDLILSKDGPGRLYYRLGLRYAPTDLDLPPLDMGFVVQRSYEAVDDPADVARLEDGSWQIRAGARVRVRLTMVADNRRYHVALVDPLPAGLEIVNPTLAVAGSIPQDPTSPDYRDGWWWWGPWYDHQNLRDERAEAFTPLLWEGTYTYTYIARATTPGTFVVPPAKAEEMYAPEVFGRSAADQVIVR